MKYLVKYKFEGYGQAEVTADNEEEAEVKFIQGKYKKKENDEWGSDYVVGERQLIGK